MRVAILCGGKGMRLNGGMHPKALAEVKDRPLVEHVMDIYKQSAVVDEFGLLLGYNGDAVRLYAMLRRWLHVECIETGRDARTSLRLLNAKGWLTQSDVYSSSGTFCVAYCDCLADVDVDKLLAFHRSHGKLATLVAVPAVSRYGVLEFHHPLTHLGDPDLPDWAVKSFREKPTTKDWVSFGFFVFEPGVWAYLDDGMLEDGPMQKLAAAGQLVAYKHSGFFACVDSPKDLETLNAVEGTPWLHT